QLHPWRRPDRRDDRAWPRRHHLGKGHRVHRRGHGRGQRRRRLRGHRAHAGNVQDQQKTRRRQGRRGMSWAPGGGPAVLIGASYLLAAALFLLGLQRMASPRTARSGIQWAGVGMLLATVATFFQPGLENIALILVAIAVGGALAWYSGRKVPITDMPQMVAMYNGLGGGSAAAIGAVELLRWSSGDPSPGMTGQVLAVTGALIGAVALSGSLIAWAKLDGRMDKRYAFPGMQVFNFLVFAAAIVLGGVVLWTLGVPWIIAFFLVALALGVLMTLPIGGAAMPVGISLYNALTGLAVSFEGYVLGDEALIIAGMMVGAAGILLTRLMAKAMNRSIKSVLFSSFGGGGQAQE